MSDGKRFRGPCSHDWVYVFNQFALCTVKGCDGKGGRCRCGSAAVEPFNAPPLVPPGSVHCVACGRVWYQGA